MQEVEDDEGIRRKRLGFEDINMKIHKLTVLVVFDLSSTVIIFLV